MVGGKGGAMLSNPLLGTVGQVTGVQGGWQTAATTWSSSWAGGTTTPTTGHVMATLGFDITGATQPYLYRDNHGDPTLNRMNTAIDMNNNDLNNANAVGAATVTTTGDATIGGNITVSSGYAYVGSATVVGDLNVAPLEHDVWSHKQMLKVVSHTPIECEKLTAAQKAGGWIDTMRVLTPEPAQIFTWWSYRAMDNWLTSNRGRRLDHVWTSDALAGQVSKIKIAKDFRGYEKPSDHVPVTATVEM